jgi:hypothetical protein
MYVTERYSIEKAHEFGFASENVTEAYVHVFQILAVCEVAGGKARLAPLGYRPQKPIGEAGC